MRRKPIGEVTLGTLIVRLDEDQRAFERYLDIVQRNHPAFKGKAEELKAQYEAIIQSVEAAADDFGQYEGEVL